MACVTDTEILTKMCVCTAADIFTVRVHIHGAGYCHLAPLRNQFRECPNRNYTQELCTLCRHTVQIFVVETLNLAKVTSVAVSVTNAHSCNNAITELHRLLWQLF
jgi:hypothetical protein